MAGVLARTDQQRGVWKSPAGKEAILQGVQGIEQRLTQPEMRQLSSWGINPIRQMSPSQFVAWGARTLSPDLEWQYLSVRRLALFLESSVQQGLAWVGVQPNDEPLWAHIRQTITMFLQSLFRQGAFQGRKAEEAYFVRCGQDTISSSDQTAGIVNIMMGFAPLKPAEFILLKIQHKAKSFPPV
jgi:phage tail sheath protein FI